MKNFFYKIWRWLLSAKIRLQCADLAFGTKLRIQFADLLLNIRNSFISLIGVKVGPASTRYFLFFSYDPIGLRLEFFFINFTPGYVKKAEDYAVKMKENYMKMFERQEQPKTASKTGVSDPRYNRTPK